MLDLSWLAGEVAVCGELGDVVGDALCQASAGLGIAEEDVEGATGTGQMMPFASWLASMIAPASRETPTP